MKFLTSAAPDGLIAPLRRFKFNAFGVEGLISVWGGFSRFSCKRRAVGEKMGYLCLAATFREGLFRLRRSGFRLRAGVYWELCSQLILGFNQRAEPRSTVRRMAENPLGRRPNQQEKLCSLGGATRRAEGELSS